MIKDTPITHPDMQTPGSLEDQLASAQAYYQDNDPAHAEAVLRELRVRAPAREDAALLLADVQRGQGRFSAAAATLLDLCRARGFEAGVSQRCAEFARQCDRHAVAAQICAGAIARGAVSPDLLMLAGNVARESGDFELARKRYLAALDAGLDLDRQHVFGALANTRRYIDADDPDIARFAAFFADARHAVLARASAGFALAKSKGDLADYAAAAHVLQGANAMARSVRRWQAPAWRDFVDARRRERVAASGEAPAGDFMPVFIVGVPRSGTTLTASLLARATGARDRGEMRALRFIAGQLIGGGHLANAAALNEAASLYRRLAVQDDAPAGCYLDQDPLNFRFLHVAAAMFPQARVIHLRRDRRDTALSLWSQDFAHPDLAFAYDFGDIRGFMDAHEVLMQHWRATLRLPVRDLDYETLVADPEGTLAGLRDFIGAPAHPQATPDHAAPVQSASVWQARQPVYTTSVGRWRHYEPFVPELAQFGETRDGRRETERGVEER